MTEPAAHPTATPAPSESTLPTTVIIVTEEPLRATDVDTILGLHDGEPPTNYRLLVPADTDRNVVSSFLDHLTLLEMREALESLRPVDRAEARSDAQEALETSLAALQAHGVSATGEVTADDPLPTLVEEVARLNATEVVVVTQPHAVEDTFHTDWASKARESLGLPVLHMYAGDWRLG